MNWTWQRFAELGVDNLYDALALRCRVFILEQGAFLYPDGVDRQCWHLLGRDDTGALHAYLRVVDAGVKYAEPSITTVSADMVGVGSLAAERLLSLIDSDVYPTSNSRSRRALPSSSKSPAASPPSTPASPPKAKSSRP